MAVKQFNLANKQRAERKLLITVVGWWNYTLTTSEPADWATAYTTYFTKSTSVTGDTYTPVPTGATPPTWAASTYYSRAEDREILGTRTEDSSIEYNPDSSTATDIRGINYTDINKTQPQQDFDPYLVLGGSKLGALLNDIRRRNALSELSQFMVYVITAFIGNDTDGYEAERHENCTILYNSIGGDANVNFPISVYLSNDWGGSGKPSTGTVDVLTEQFEFTEDA